MKAFLARKYGPPTLLRSEEIPIPTPKSDELLVKVVATTVNDFDWSMVTGKPAIYKLLFGMSRPKRPMPGMEFSGVVEAIGDDVTAFKPGDEVYGDISAKGWGTFAEFACVHESTVMKKPAEMSFVDAAAIPHAAMLAYQGLVTLGNISNGQKVLVNGAGGGMGTFAVQIASEYDVELTGVDSAQKADLMKSMGYHHTLDYRETDFTKTGEKYDLILDARTKRPVRAFLRSLNPGGRYVTVGGDIGKMLQVTFLRPFVSLFTSKSVQLLALKQNNDLGAIEKLYSEGKLRPVVDGPHAFEEIPRQIDAFGKGTHKGKIVIRISEP